MRVLLDANILVSFLLTKGSEGTIYTIVRAFFDGKFTLLLPQELLNEILDVISMKPRLAKRISLQEANKLVSDLLSNAEVLPPVLEKVPAITRDPKDDYLIAYALVGQADSLVTRDKDLLTLGAVGGVKVVSPASFAGLIATADGL